MNLKNEIDYQANQWLIKQNEGLDKQEKAKFDIWLKNENNKKAYDESKEIIDECLKLDDDFIKEIETEALQNKSVNNIFYKNSFIAACVIAVSVIFITVFNTYNSSLEPIFSKNYISKNEKILNIILPDNSIIDLDAKSHVKVEYYKDKRVVNFTKGIAFFNIAKDKTKPFRIKIDKTIITVIGTKFEVINLDKSTTVNVTEGIVKVDYIYDQNSDKSKTLGYLKEAQTLTLNSLGKILKHDKIDINKIATWKKDIIHFDKTTLKEAFALFKRYSNQKVEFQTKELSLLKISGKFSTLHYDSFLESIELIYPIKISQQEDKILVTELN